MGRIRVWLSEGQVNGASISSVWVLKQKSSAKARTRVRKKKCGHAKAVYLKFNTMIYVKYQKILQLLEYNL